jgi:hypothetical protein
MQKEIRERLRSLEKQQRFAKRALTVVNRTHDQQPVNREYTSRRLLVLNIEIRARAKALALCYSLLNRKAFRAEIEAEGLRHAMKHLKSCQAIPNFERKTYIAMDGIGNA